MNGYLQRTEILSNWLGQFSNQTNTFLEMQSDIIACSGFQQHNSDEPKQSPVLLISMINHNRMLRARTR